MDNQAITQSLSLLRQLHIVRNDEQYKTLLSSLTHLQGKALVVSWVNAHALTLAQKNALLRTNLLKSDVIFRDGIGVSLLMRLLGMEAGYNLNGTDLIPEIIRRFNGKSIALFGTEEPYLSKAAQVIEGMGGNVILRIDGFQEPEVYVQRLAQVPADLVILAMGMPKQEQVAIMLAEHVKRSCLILNGGAILDFMSNRFPRAPLLWRKCRMEWVYRLIQEPKRLWRRYILGGLFFAGYAIQLFYINKCKPRQITHSSK